MTCKEPGLLSMLSIRLPETTWFMIKGAIRVTEIHERRVGHEHCFAGSKSDSYRVTLKVPSEYTLSAHLHEGTW